MFRALPHSIGSSLMLFGIFQQCHKYLVLLVKHDLKVLLLELLLLLHLFHQR